MTRMKTQEEFIDEVKSIHETSLSVLGKYKGRKNYVLMKCNQCNREFNMRPDTITQGAGCRYCSGNVKLTTEDVKEELQYYFGGRVTLLSDYKNSVTKLNLRDNETGVEFSQTRGHLYEGFTYKDSGITMLHDFKSRAKRNTSKRDRVANKGLVRDSNSYQSKLEDKYPKRFKLITPYKTMRDTVTVHCNECDRNIKVKAGMLLEYGSCRVCRGFKHSSMEKFIYLFLVDNNINFEYQKPIKVSEYPNTLYNDFTLPDYKVVIEMDGAQHYANEGMYYSKTYEYRDSMKELWAKNNEYTLIRIGEREVSDLFDILNPYLGKLKLKDYYKSGKYNIDLKGILNDSYSMGINSIALKYHISSYLCKSLIKLINK